MTDSLVSIVIPCYNQEAFLHEAIRSCLQQDYPNLEVVVVNDGSTDGSAAVAAEFSDSITYIEQSNRGVSAARNAGIRQARGELIALLDGDDVSLPGRIRYQAEYLANNPKIGMVTGHVLHFDGNPGVTAAVDPVGSFRLRDGQQYRLEAIDCFTLPSTWMMRRQCYDAVGGFDERFRRAGGEDWLFSVQLALYCSLAFLGRPFALYRRHTANITNDERFAHEQDRLAAKIALEWVHFPEYPPAMQAHLLYYRFASSWRTEPKSQSIRYFWAALRADPSQWLHGIRILGRGFSATLNRRLG